jgi:hypothetical protein
MARRSSNESLARDSRIGSISTPLPLGAYRIFRGGQKAAWGRKSGKRLGMAAGATSMPIRAFAEVT